MRDFYLIIAGSRTFADYDMLCKITDRLLGNHQNDTIHIIEGECRGVDELAKRYAIERRYTIHPFPADWNRYGKSAGPVRNEQMHQYIAQFPNRGCLCFLDGESRGTAHNFTLAEQFGTQLRICHYKQKEKEEESYGK